jgi:F-type H+-transporting ATPase subunit epsilon
VIGKGMLECAVVTPDRTLFQATAGKVIVAGYDDGEIGFLPGHAAYIGTLGTGVARIESESGTVRFGIYGGFVQVERNQVTLLCSRAERPEDVTEESIAADRQHLAELSTGSDEGYAESQRLALRIRVREKLRQK